ncbi:MAG: hypothetical protein HQP61_02210 [Peptococcaceae bacterium]|nr:hypothetical protein [Candidatus Syntrophopropionicum ammoniitolerans]
MTPTEDLRLRLRRLLNEVIPPVGTESDTQFFDCDLDEILLETQSIYGAAATGWAMKAGMLQGQIESYAVGQERYDLTSLRDRVAHAFAMAEKYTAMAKAGGGSVMLKITKPEVL